MICKHCGKEIKDDAKVCRYCGKAVRHAGKKYKRVKARPATASVQGTPQHKHDDAKETDENKPQELKTQQGAQAHKKHTHSSGHTNIDAKTKKPDAERKELRHDSHTTAQSKPRTEHDLAAQDKPRTRQAPAGDHHRAKTHSESAKSAAPAKSSNWAVIVGCLLVGCAIIFAALILGMPEDAPEDAAEPAASNSITETEQHDEQAEEIRAALEAAALRESNGIKIVEDSQFDADIREIADTVAEDAEKYLASYEQGGYLYMSLAETLKGKYTEDVSANISAVFRVEQGDVEQMLSRIDNAAGEDSAGEFIETFYEQSGGIAVKVHYSVCSVADDIWAIGTYIYV